jgi:hypothetical protein
VGRNRRTAVAVTVALAAALGGSSCSYLLVGDPLLGTVQNLAQGGCLAQCSPGYRCNDESALCEPERPDAAAAPTR